MANGSEILASNRASRDESSITLTIDDILRLQNDSVISATTRSGIGGEIVIREVNDVFLNDSAISSSASDGVAGDLRVNASEQIRLSGKRSDEDSGGFLVESLRDEGGNLTVQASQLIVEDGASISASTDTGNAGDVVINASESIRFSNQAVLSVQTALGDDSGPDDRPFSIENESRRDVRESGDRNTTVSDLPIAGSLSLQTERLDVEDGSSILVSSPNGQAGSVEIDANQVFLDDGEVRATTLEDSINGDDSANVEISGLELLLLKNGSLISAEALESASGGNIALNFESGFIIAPPQENSDIIATAAGEGDGGSIQIRTQRLFGLQENSGSFNELRNNQANEMSVTSTLGINGTIAVDQLRIDPVQAVAELPNDLRPPLLNEGCRPGSGQGTFINIEQGGIPSGPDDQIDGDELWEYLLPGQHPADRGSIETFLGTDNSLQTHSQDVARVIVEVDGWTVVEDGHVVLTAQTTSEARHHPCLMR